VRPSPFCTLCEGMRVIVIILAGSTVGGVSNSVCDRNCVHLQNLALLEVTPATVIVFVAVLLDACDCYRCARAIFLRYPSDACYHQ